MPHIVDPRLPTHVPNPSAFSALSSAAVEELYALEREEAIRRAEYEIRHTEAIRRAEYEARCAEILSSHGRVSKSGSATPLVFTAPNERGDESYFGISKERERERDRAYDDGGFHHGRHFSLSSIRRDNVPSSLHPHSSGHVVDTNGPSSGRGHTHGVWSHPYHHPPPSHRHHSGYDREDPPSPISSDGESIIQSKSPHHLSSLTAPHTPHTSQSTHTPHNSHNSHPYSSHSHSSSHVPYGADQPQSIQGTKADFTFTPSTSPFLGGLRTLNIHSSGPSRAPSPFRLSPPSLESPVEEYGPHYTHSHSSTRRRIPSLVGSPPRQLFASRKRGSTGDLVSYGKQHSFSYSNERERSSYSPNGALSYGIPPYAHEPSLTALPTPQLSSGPSSSGSSPGSHHHSLSGYMGGQHPGGSTSGSGSLSASSSRPASPPLWNQNRSPGAHHSHASHPYRDARGEHPHHHHIAHSVRVAFGMTPIHPRPSRNAPPSSSASGSATAVNPSSASGSSSDRHSDGSTSTSTAVHFNMNPPPVSSHSLSVPVSRASSPPIKLPPLKLPSSPSSPNHRGHTLLSVRDLLNPDSASAPAVTSSSSSSSSSLRGEANVNLNGVKGLIGVNGPGSGNGVKATNGNGGGDEIESGMTESAPEGEEKVALPRFSEVEAATGASRR